MCLVPGLQYKASQLSWHCSSAHSACCPGKLVVAPVSQLPPVIQDTVWNHVNLCLPLNPYLCGAKQHTILEPRGTVHSTIYIQQNSDFQHQQCDAQCVPHAIQWSHISAEDRWVARLDLGVREMFSIWNSQGLISLRQLFFRYRSCHKCMGCVCILQNSGLVSLRFKILVF